MTPTNHAAAVAEAVRIVQEAGLDADSRAGAAAIAALLDAMLREEHGRGPAAPKSAQSDLGGRIDDSPSPAEIIARWAEVSPDAVADVATFDSGSVDLTLHTSSLPQAKSGRQRLLALLKLALERVAFERVDVPAREINALCERYDALDQNLPANLQNYENYVLRRGSPGSYSYRLTQFGLDHARNRMREVVDAT